MSLHYHALRQFKKNETYKAGDVLVLFGELFTRGYANGLVEEAERRGMTIVRSTVGRREQGVLRALNAEEAAAVPKPFINIPLEAGFDLEPAGNQGPTPVDQLKNVKLSDWESFKMDRESILQSQKNGQIRFCNQVKEYLIELEKHIPAGANVLFAHLMAGGVPRTKIVMPLMNRAFKGTGERWLSSEKFWESDIGQICSMSFNEVTANTFDFLVQESSTLREKLKSQGRHVGYLAYGYHGTEVLIDNEYTWQTYSPYIQGWAKMRLENFAESWTKRGVTCAVYNAPEILTNSSSIFQGVEVSLYTLVGALKKEGGNSHKALDTLSKCQSVLKPEFSLEDVMTFTANYLKSAVIREHCDFEKWPQHSGQKQMQLMLESSDHLISMHKDEKVLLTQILSEVVFAGCGKVMLNDIADPESPVAWINHDILAKVHSERV